METEDSVPPAWPAPLAAHAAPGAEAGPVWSAEGAGVGDELGSLSGLLARWASRPLLIDGQTGSSVTGGFLMGIARSIASGLDAAAPVAVLCGDRFVHAVTTTSALAAGMSVIPLEPETPGWLLKPMLRAASEGLLTVFTDLQTGGAHGLFHSMRVVDARAYLGAAAGDDAALLPERGSLLSVYQDARGTYRRTEVPARRAWCAARDMGTRLGLTEHWVTASITSLGTPGAFMGDVLSALASNAAVMIMPRLLIGDPVRSLAMMLDRGIHSFSAPEYALRHLLAGVRLPRRGSLRFAVSTSALSFCPRFREQYAHATGHGLIGGQASLRSPLLAALASPERPDILRGGMGLPVRAPLEQERTRMLLLWDAPLSDELGMHGDDAPAELHEVLRRDGALDVAGPCARFWVAAEGTVYDFERLDRTLIQLPDVVDSYTLSLPSHQAKRATLASLVVLDAQLSDQHLRQAITGLTPDPAHSFVRVSEVPRLPDGRPLAEDARALVRDRHGT